MPTMSTGLVVVAGYANKIRRTMFAQLKDKIKSGELTNREVAYKVGILNKMLFEVLISSLRLDKYDAVRIRIDYEVENGEVKWDYDSIQIEVWKRNDELAEKAVELFKELQKEEEFMREAGYEIRKAGETPLGEEVYIIERSGERVGAFKVMKVNNEAVIVGAIKEPPRKIRAIIPSAESQESIEMALPSALSRGTSIDEEEAEKIIEEVLGEIEA